jgi:hypothetical protein
MTATFLCIYCFALPDYETTTLPDSPPTLRRDAELLAFDVSCEDYCEREVDEVDRRAVGVCTCTWALAGTILRDARQWGLCLVRGRPVVLVGLDPVATAVGRSPGPAPDHRLGTVGRPSLAGMGDQAALRPGSGEKASAYWGDSGLAAGYTTVTLRTPATDPEWRSLQRLRSEQIEP